MIPRESRSCVERTTKGFLFDLDSRGVLTLTNPGGGGIRLRDYGLTYGNGPIVCAEDGSIVLPSSAFVPFPGRRFPAMADEGFSTNLWLK